MIPNRLFAACWMVLALSRAQSQDPPDRFEAASVRENSVGGRTGGIRRTPGGVTARNITLRGLLREAYQVKGFQFVGGPAWLKSDKFDVVAKASATSTPEQIQHMFQTLLKERFKLELHRETKLMPVYTLVVNKAQPKLRESAAGDGRIRAVRGQVKGEKVTTESLADFLSGFLGRVVLDKTGLTGFYDFELEFTPPGGTRSKPASEGASSFDDAAAPTLLTAVRKQLGLKLEARKGPVEVLVIDRVEKLSNEN